MLFSAALLKGLGVYADPVGSSISTVMSKYSRGGPVYAYLCPISIWLAGPRNRTIGGMRLQIWHTCAIHGIRAGTIAMSLGRVRPGEL